MTDLSYYQILGVSEDSSLEDVKRSYRKAMRALHPDQAGEATTGMATLVNQAYATLGDPKKRAEYDLSRTKATPQPENQPQKKSWGQEQTSPRTTTTTPNRTQPQPSWGTADSHEKPWDTTKKPQENVQDNNTYELITPKEQGIPGHLIGCLLMTTGFLAPYLFLRFLHPGDISAGLTLGPWVSTIAAFSLIAVALMTPKRTNTQKYHLATWAASVAVFSLLAWDIHRSDGNWYSYLLLAVCLMFILTGYTLVHAFARDRHGRSYPGVYVFPETHTHMWPIGDPPTPSTQEFFSQFKKPGIRLFYGTQIPAVLIRERTAVIIQFTNTLSPGEYEWTRKGLCPAGTHQVLIPQVNPSQKELKRQATRLNKVFTVYVTPDGVRTDAARGNVLVVPVSEASDVILGLLEARGGTVRVDRRTLRDVFQAVG